MKMEGIFAPYGFDIRGQWGDAYTLGTGGFFGEAVFGDAVYGNQYYCELADSFGIFQKREKAGKPYLDKTNFYQYKITHTQKQDDNRTKFKLGKNAWKALTDEQRAVYNERAEHLGFSGYCLFIKEYMLTP